MNKWSDIAPQGTAAWPWQIPLSQGKFALVDECDFENLSKYKWHLYEGYAARCLDRKVFGRCRQQMHVMLMGDERLVDHKNRNRLDNRRDNLRFCTFAQNVRNRTTNKNNTSGHKGVHWHNGGKMWRSQIMWDGKRKSLGYFKELPDAIAAYAEAAKQLHGEFANV